MRELIYKYRYRVILFVLFASYVLFFFSFYIISTRIEISKNPVILAAAAAQSDKKSYELTKNDIKNITELDLSYTELSDIKYLSVFTNLKKLNLNGIYTPIDNKLNCKEVICQAVNINVSKGEYIDLEPLRKLDKLESLSIGYHVRVKNIEAISTLSNLKELSLKYSCDFNDISSIARFKNLETLCLHGTQISDIGPVRNLKKLRNLNISCTSVSDLGPLRNLRRLRAINLSYSDVQNLERVRKLNNLKYLDISGTAISDLTPVKNLKNLQTLMIKDCCNIKNEQVKDLQKILPQLNIYSDIIG